MDQSNVHLLPGRVIKYVAHPHTPGVYPIYLADILSLYDKGVLHMYMEMKDTTHIPSEWDCYAVYKGGRLALLSQ